MQPVVWRNWLQSTLLVSASHDIISPPRCGQALAAGIPGARWFEVPDAAHGVTIQCPEIINNLLAGQFETTRKAPLPAIQ